MTRTPRLNVSRVPLEAEDRKAIVALVAVHGYRRAARTLGVGVMVLELAQDEGPCALAIGLR